MLPITNAGKLMLRKKAGFIFLGLSTQLGGIVYPGSVSAAIDTKCGGSIYLAVKQTWNSSIRKYIAVDKIEIHMKREGDVYPLYDIQSYLYNFYRMASRCGDHELLNQIAETLLPIFDLAIQEKGEVKWVCRGGTHCTTKNGLLGKEIQLNTLQFLGLASALAAKLAHSDDANLSPSSREFVTKASDSAYRFVARMAKNKNYVKSLEMNRQESPGDPRRNPASKVLRDHEIWMLTILANLAGTTANGQLFKREAFPDEDVKKLSNELLELFYSRTHVTGNLGSGEATAEIDRGFWSYHKDNQFAGYTANSLPADLCKRSELQKYNPSGKVQESAQIKRMPPVPQNLGWDISHARRLVPLFDSFSDYREQMSHLYALPIEKLDGDLKGAYAQQLIKNIWNQDEKRPLFKNYWSGANGWYRVGFKGGGKCTQGYPPFGLSIAVPTGGYFTWAAKNAKLAELGASLYSLTSDKNEEASAFMEKNYRGLSRKATQRTRELNQFMFYPTLVGVQ